MSAATNAPEENVHAGQDLTPTTFSEIIALRDGQDLAAFRAHHALMAQVRAASTLHLHTPPDQWAALTFNWDFSVASQRFALDGLTQREFDSQFAQGLCLGWASIAQLDNALSNATYRPQEQLWQMGDAKKLACAIEYLHRGLPITPVLIAPLAIQRKIYFHGGNHRYVAAKFCGYQHHVPVYCAPIHQADISSIVPVEWVQTATAI